MNDSRDEFGFKLIPHSIEYFDEHGYKIAAGLQHYFWHRWNYIFYCAQCGKVYGRVCARPLDTPLPPYAQNWQGQWHDHRGECADCGDGTLIDWKYDDLAQVPIELAIHAILAATQKGAPQDERNVYREVWDAIQFADSDTWLADARRWIEQSDRPPAVDAGSEPCFSITPEAASLLTRRR